MRKVTQEIVTAFLAKKKKANKATMTTGGSLYLHGNEIARHSLRGRLQITNAGWFSATTKERLNGLPGVSIFQKAGNWYLNGKEWDGSWVTV